MERIQIAGIHDLNEAICCLRAGARQLGFPLGLNVHEEDCAEDEARRICRSLPGDVEKTVITYLDRAGDIARLCRWVGASVVQIHGEIPVRELARLREMAPGLAIIKSLIVKSNNRETLFLAVERWLPWVDAFISDTFDPETGASGATGKTHDWKVSRALVTHSSKPLILAGGLNPDNAARAISMVRPWGVDSHTGVEGCDGKKDYALVRAFVMNSEAAFEALET
ncbi:MAG: phosphoribosylanthranilate isomerase [Syntrophales bacterium]|jgi:phosphoribosylanthranilate isomerase|nr:phosphoribosylanthranilate isomerase [Syntrophales bacterium]